MADTACFAGIEARHRLGLLGCIGLALSYPAWHAIAGPTQLTGLGLLSWAALLALIALLVIRTGPESGWLYPPTAIALFSLLDGLRLLPALVWGIQGHLALPGDSPERLAGLIAFQAALTALGLASFCGGFLISPLGPGPDQLRSAPPPRLRGFALLWIAASVLGTALMLWSRGGWKMHLLSLGFGRATALAGHFYLIMLLTSGTTAWLLWYAAEAGVTKRPLFWLAGLCALPLGYILTGSRSALLTPLVAGAMIHLWQGGRLRFRVLIPLGLLFLVFAGTAASVRRGAAGGEARLSEVSLVDRDAIADVASEILVRAAGEGAVPPILARVPVDQAPLWGQSYLALVGIAVPRTLWPGKPRSIDGRVGEVFFGVNHGIPPGGLGEAYWNLGVGGVVGAFFLLGLFFRLLAARVRSHRNSPYFTAAFILALWQLRTPGTSSAIAWLMSLVQIALVAGSVQILGRMRSVPRETPLS